MSAFRMSPSSWSTEELVHACIESDNQEAWQEFIRRFRNLIGCIILRIAYSYGEGSYHIIDDLIRETYLKICSANRRLLRTFEPQHPNAFLGMLKVTAINVAHDYFRCRRAAKRGAGATECQLTEVPELTDSHTRNAIDIERDILLGEIDVVLTGIASPTASRDRDIFWLHYRQGLTAKAIADLPAYNLTTKGVESILYRLTNYIRTHLVSRNSGPEIREMQRESSYSSKGVE